MLNNLWVDVYNYKESQTNCSESTFLKRKKKKRNNNNLKILVLLLKRKFIFSYCWWLNTVETGSLDNKYISNV